MCKPKATLGKPRLSVVAGRLYALTGKRSCCAAGSTAPTTTTRDRCRTGLYAELVGGPLDGLLLDITGWTAEEIQTGVALMTELGQFGPGGRVLYDPRPGERNRWDWSGDTP